MKSNMKISGVERRAVIINTARKLFVEKGFDRTTTRELAEVAGISEALLFKHFANKEAIYTAIKESCFEEEEQHFAELMKSLEPSSSSLVVLVQVFVSHVLSGQQDEKMRTFMQLVFRSLMEGGDFARLAIQQGGLSRWIQKVQECMEASRVAGDMLDGPVSQHLGAWFINDLITGLMLLSLPAKSVIERGVSHAELVKQVIWFSLRGMGMREDVIRLYYRPEEIALN